jgi:hypothetical protein
VDKRAFILFVIVDLLGVVGAVLVALPFLREFGLKRLLNLHGLPVVMRGFGRSQGAAPKVVEREMTSFKPRDGSCVIWGLLAIGASYLLHILAEAIEFNAH